MAVQESGESRRMIGVFRWTLAFISVLGVFAIGVGIAGLLGVPMGKDGKEQASTVELIVAIVAGVWMVPFGITALRNARVELDDRELRYLRFGLWCFLGRIPLRHVERYGVGEESPGHKRYHVLLLALTDGSRRSIRISMYEEWRSFVDALGARLDREASATKTTFLGASLDAEANS